MFSFTLISCEKNNDNPGTEDVVLTEEQQKAYDDFQNIKEFLNESIPDVISEDVTFTHRINNYGLIWTTSNWDILPLTGKIGRHEGDVIVVLEATLDGYEIHDSFKKTVTVKGYGTKVSDKLVFAYIYGDNIKNERDYHMMDYARYAFGLIDDGKLDLSQKKNIDNFVDTTHSYGVKVILSIGGWGADGYSLATRTKVSRTRFINSVVEAVKKHNLQGIDYVWEYPTGGHEDIGKHPSDKENFTLLIKETREAFDEFDKTLLLTAAFSASVDSANNYYEVKELNKYLSYFFIMTYDAEHRSWPSTNPPSGNMSHHSALYKSTLYIRANSVKSSVEEFRRLGAANDKIVIGAAFFGKIMTTNTNTKNPLGAKYVSKRNADYTEIKNKFTDKHPENVYFDESAQAPYYYDGKTFITYDDSRSVIAKTTYVIEEDLAGIMFWNLDGDETGTLITAIYSVLTK